MRQQTLDSTTDDSATCTTLPHILARQARIQPDATALLWRNESHSYAALQQRAQRIASALAALGETGDRIAVLSWNCPDYVALIYGVAAAGRILVPLNARLAAAEWIYQLAHTQCRLLFAAPELAAELQAHRDFPQDITVVALDEALDAWLTTAAVATPPAVQAQDPAWILFTSGSTGRPKGVVLTHAAFMAGLDSAALARPVQPTDRYFYPFPLFHIAAHNVLLQHLYGATVVLARSFDADDTLHACRTLGVTSMSLAPTMIAMLMDHPDFHVSDLNNVHTIGYGASAMPLSLLRRLLDESNVGLCQSYGMTELCGSVAFLTVADHRAAANAPHLLTAVGKPLPTAEIRIAGDAQGSGEILVKAAQCMRGYWRDPDATGATLRDGWLHTGDIGRFDEDGYLYIVDRKKDMIISGGENVASREVEEALRKHPAVQDCAVIGLPHPRWGESVCAVVCVQSQVDDAQLEAHCRELLAGYKTPRRWFRTEALPLNASGKVDKPRLREHYAQPGVT